MPHEENARNIVDYQIAGLYKIFHKHLQANYKNVSIVYKEEIFHILATTYFSHKEEAILEIVNSYLEGELNEMQSLIGLIKIELKIMPKEFINCYETILKAWEEKGFLKKYKIYYDQLDDSKEITDRFHDVAGAFLLRLIGAPDATELIHNIQNLEKEWAYPRPTIITVNSEVLFNWSFLSLDEVCQYFAKGIENVSTL